MKKSLMYVATAALLVTLACSTKKKVEDQTQAPTPMTESSPVATSPSTETPGVTVLPENGSSTTTSIPDETSQVASLGASSSGRSR